MANENLKCILVGEESLLVQCGEILIRQGHEVAAIISANPVIRRYAEAQGIACAPFDDLTERLAQIDYDFLFSIANLRMIPDAVWQKARRGAVNFHDGPLPRYAGLNVPAWAILGGETEHGITWHAMASEADTGEIYEQEIFPIAPEETALTLNTKCFEAAISSFAALAERLETGLVGRPQDLGQRTYFSRNQRPGAAGTLVFNRPTAELERLFRALDFGTGYTNPLVTAKVRCAEGVYAVTRLAAAPSSGFSVPGSVLAVDGQGVSIATADGAVVLEARRLGDGAPLSEAVRPGLLLPALGLDEVAALDAAVVRAAGREGTFRKAIAAAQDVDLVDVKGPVAGAAVIPSVIPLDLPAGLGRYAAPPPCAAFPLRISGQESLSFAYADADIRATAAAFPDDFADAVPLAAQAGEDLSVADFTAQIAHAVAAARGRGSYLADLPLRVPHLSAPHLTLGLVEPAGSIAGAAGLLPRGCALAFIHAEDGAALVFDAARVGEGHAADLAARLAVLAGAFAAGGPVRALPLMSAEEEQRVLYTWNDTARPLPADLVHALFEAQADRTPDAVAVVAGADSLTYAALDARANRIAHALRARGVGPDVLVGLHVSRSIDLVAGALGILKAGGAYVPLDPMFPADRLALMVEDSAAPIVLTERALADRLVTAAEVLVVEDIAAAGLAGRITSDAGPENLAYVIYTSGSTGRPKGVMIAHRNVGNFFVGMDERIAIPQSGQPVWLAVTSLSFDISVLELFWTLARGFKVVIHSAEVRAHKLAGDAATKAVDFGLFYWGNDDGAGPAKYRLLLEGAKFADANGFTAVWTPERHFHAFGGPYPNPAVTGAAVAAVTRNLSIRAGSCVLPLHHPARVAEDWAVLDNISNGRVGLAVAAGWMPEDFVLRPQSAPPNNKTAMLRDMETVRRLWRGEKVEFDFNGAPVGIVTQPRPVQAELPLWITTAGNPDTYREAARAGANVLTHLLGQSIDELADKIRIYRETLKECGRNPDDYKVTLMLHTLLGDCRDEVRERARGPMKDYLRSAAALIKQYAWAFPAFKKPAGAGTPADIDLRTLDAEEMDAILEFAFLRYFDDSGLFGTVSDAMRRVEQISAIGVDEVACLIDFGVPSDIVLERLTPLAEVVAKARNVGIAPAAPVGLAAEIREHKVTHLQCTPAMARMFLSGEDDRVALAEVRHLFLGGEALPASLVRELRSVTSASIENMYGPTETTIWSSTMPAVSSEGVVPLGRPIANTQLYVLDGARRPVAPGVPGELYIGGAGVARGYHNRPDLTAERFLPDPFTGGSFYRTGDVARFDAHGTLHFLGRADHQVKVRGYRIELGEIEARLSTFPGIAEAVTIVRADREDDARIVAYVRLASGPLDEAALRAHLAETLPDYMVPAHIVVMEAFPLTPNAKVDRKALPRPEVAAEASQYVAPEGDTERQIAEVFRRVLGIERVSLSDNFFALGGHSLLAVQAHRELKAKLAPDMAITDLFRFPTVAALAAHLSNRDQADEALSKVADRAAMRRAALSDRRASLARQRIVG